MSDDIERLRAIGDAVAALKAENAQLWEEIAQLETVLKTARTAALEEAATAAVDFVGNPLVDTIITRIRALANKEGER